MVFTSEKLFKQLLDNNRLHIRSQATAPREIKRNYVHQMTYGAFVDVHKNCSLDPIQCKKNRLQNKDCSFFSLRSGDWFKEHFRSAKKSHRRLRKEKSKIHAIWPLYRGTTKRFYNAFKDESSDCASSENSIPLSVLKKSITEDEKTKKSLSTKTRNSVGRRRGGNGLRKSLSRRNYKIDEKNVERTTQRASISEYTPKQDPTTTQNSLHVQPRLTLQNLLKIMVDCTNDSDALIKSESYRRHFEILPTMNSEKGSILIELPETVKYKCKLDLSSMKDIIGLLLEPELSNDNLKLTKPSSLNASEFANNEHFNKTPTTVELNSQTNAASTEILVTENASPMNAALKLGKLAAPIILLPASMYPLNINLSTHPNWTGYANGNVEPPVPVRVTSLNGSYDQTHFFNVPTIFSNQNINVQHINNTNSVNVEQASNKKQKCSPKKRGRKPRSTETVAKITNKSKQKPKPKPKPKVEPVKRPTIIKCRVSKQIKAETDKNAASPSEAMVANDASYLAALDMPLLNEELNRGPESNNSQQTQPSSGVFSAQSSCNNTAHTTPSYHQDFKGFNCSFGNLHSEAEKNSQELFSVDDIGTVEPTDLLEQFHLGEVGEAQRDYNHDFSIDNEMSSTTMYKQQYSEDMQKFNSNNLVETPVVASSQFLDLSNFDCVESNDFNQFQNLPDVTGTNDSTLIPKNEDNVEQSKMLGNRNNTEVFSASTAVSNENNLENIFKNPPNTTIRLPRVQCSEKRRLSYDDVVVSLREPKKPCFARGTRLSFTSADVNVHSLAMPTSAASSKQHNILQPKHTTAITEDPALLIKPELLWQQRNIPEKPPLLLLKAQSPSCSRREHCNTDIEIKHGDVKVISNQVITLPNNFLAKSIYQDEFMKFQQQNYFNSIRGEKKPFLKMTSTSSPPLVREDCLQNTNATIKESSSGAGSSAHPNCSILPSSGLLNATANNNKSNIDRLSANHNRNLKTFTHPIRMLRKTHEDAVVNTLDKWTLKLNERPIVVNSNKCNKFLLPPGIVTKGTSYKRGNEIQTSQTIENASRIENTAKPNNRTKVLYFDTINRTCHPSSHPDIEEPKPNYEKSNSECHNTQRTVTQAPALYTKHEDFPGSSKIASQSEMKLFAKNEEIGEPKKEDIGEIKPKTSTPILKPKNDLGIFMPLLELDSKFDDCLDFECESVGAIENENDCLSLSPNAKTELINESLKNFSPLNNQPNGEFSIDSRMTTMGQEQNNMNLKSTGTILENIPEKITLRRKSDGGCLRKRNHISRLSMDQITREIRNSKRSTIYKCLNIEKTKNDVPQTLFSLKESDPRKHKNSIQPQPTDLKNKNSKMTCTLIEPAQSGHMNALMTNTDKPILIEVPAHPRRTSDRNDLNEFYKTAEQLLSSTSKKVSSKEENKSIEIKQRSFQNHFNTGDSSVKMLQLKNSKFNHSINDSLGVFDYSKFFNIQCLPSLSDVSECCSMKPHAPLRDRSIVQNALVGMTQAQVHDLYVFVRRRKKLFSYYYEAFWFYFRERKSLKGLLCLLHDGEYNECFPITALPVLYQSFQKCGLTKQDACHLILNETKQRTTDTINNLLEIILASDWTLFGTSIKTLSKYRAAVFSPSILERMAEGLMQNYNTQLASVFFSCLAQSRAEDIVRIFSCNAVMAVFNLMYAKLHN